MAHDESLLGHRVVVRSLVRGEQGPSGGPAMTDTLGTLESIDEREVVVRRRDGSTRRLDRSDIVVMKEVPPPPVPRRHSSPPAH